ncbi:MAG: hypothetical protein IJB29_07300 [Mailhella sp.]|nr:hypothetical protein [Mailhella sp.]
MEDRAAYPGQAEEVIELHDIVADTDTEGIADDVVELAASDIVPAPAPNEETVVDLVDVASPDDEPVELTENDVVSHADEEALELTEKVESPTEFLSLPARSQEEEVPFGEAVAVSEEAAGCDVPLELAEPEAAATAEEASELSLPEAAEELSAPELLPAPMEDASEGAPADPAVSPDVEACFNLVAELDERVRALEARFDTASSALEKRLADAERECSTLAARVDELTRQAEEGAARFLTDDTFLAFLEEKIALAVAARVPAPAEAEDPAMLSVTAEAVPGEELHAELSEDMTEAAEAVAEDTPADSEESAPASEATEDSPADIEAERDVIREIIGEIAQHVGELEERVAAWELRCEQEASLAAARVIREEIAAMKADAARIGSR